MFGEENRMLMLHITPVERAVLECLASGSATTDIARRLGVKELEIESCLATLFARMGVASRAEAVAAAARRGLLGAA